MVLLVLLVCTTLITSCSKDDDDIPFTPMVMSANPSACEGFEVKANTWKVHEYTIIDGIKVYTGDDYLFIVSCGTNSMVTNFVHNMGMVTPEEYEEHIFSTEILEYHINDYNGGEGYYIYHEVILGEPIITANIIPSRIRGCVYYIMDSNDNIVDELLRIYFDGVTCTWTQKYGNFKRMFDIYKP